MRAARSSDTTRWRVFLVDDHPMTRYGIAQLLKAEREFEVCGEADTAPRALAAVKSLKPDLVLADLTMPGKDGLGFVKDMRIMHPHVAVLVVSMHDEALYAERVLRAGARGYVMKHAGGKELLQAIRHVLEGHIYVSEEIAAKALDAFSGRRSRTEDSVVGQLTDRELEVFQCLGQGLTSRQIGERLHMSVKTVETHRRHAREKLKLKSGPELIKFAVRWSSSQ